MNAEEKKYDYVIYLHRNLINGKVYVGQTIQLPSKRWAKGKGYPTNLHFKRAIEKYGWDNFEHIIIEEFHGTPEEAGIKEEQYIEIYNSTNPEYGYNICKGGQLSPVAVESAVKWMKEHPEFGLARVAEMHKWQREHPEEAKAITKKFNQAGINARKRPVMCIETGIIYESATEAARQVPKTSQSKISMCCSGQRKTCGGLHWQYVCKKEEEKMENKEFSIPNTCPVCGGKTEIIKTENTEVLMCTNQLCKGKLLGKLNTFVSKKGFDIRGLSEQTLSKFIELGWVNSFIDIFNLKDHKQELMTFDGFGTTSVNKLLKAIEDSRHNVNPRNFLVALSIPGIGEGQAKSIINVYGSVEKFFNALEHGVYINVNGIGDILNNNIFNWYENIYKDDNIDVLLSIIDFETEMSRQTDSNLNGLTFVITGAVNKFKNRKELEEFINSHGGKVSGSVSKNTDYLINNDKMSASGKNNKAKELGIAIITEDEFMELVKEKIK